jgi:hypothetical protein
VGDGDGPGVRRPLLGGQGVVGLPLLLAQVVEGLGLLAERLSDLCVAQTERYRDCRQAAERQQQRG